MRFGCLVAVTAIIQVFWDVTLCHGSGRSDISVITEPSSSGSSSPRMATQEKSEYYTGVVEVGSKWSVWQTCRAVGGEDLYTVQAPRRPQLNTT